METLTMMNAIMYPLLVDSDMWENPHLIQEDTEPSKRNKWIDTKDGYTLEVEVPGFSKEELTLELDNDQFHIKAEKRKKARNTHTTKLMTFNVPKGVDTGRVNAKCENGLLTIRLKKRVAKQAREIPVNGSFKGQDRKNWRERFFSFWKSDNLPI